MGIGQRDGILELSARRWEAGLFVVAQASGLESPEPSQHLGHAHTQRKKRRIPGGFGAKG